MRKVLFDVDGTLINGLDQWNRSVVEYAREVFEDGGVIYVWSFGGKDYADRHCGRLLREEGIPTAGGFDKGSLAETIGLIQTLGIEEIVDDSPPYEQELRALGVKVRLVWLNQLTTTMDDSSTALWTTARV